MLNERILSVDGCVLPSRRPLNRTSGCHSGDQRVPSTLVKRAVLEPFPVLGWCKEPEESFSVGYRRDLRHQQMLNGRATQQVKGSRPRLTGVTGARR